MALWEHPGFLGLTSQGVIAIHADWPIYPEEHGPELALLWLTAFPRSTRFITVDDLDRCILLTAAIGSSRPADTYNERHFHIAIWHEDLISLHADDLVIGGEGTLTEREWYERSLSQLPPGPYFIKLDDGTMKEVTLPDFSECDDREPYALILARDGLVVSERGHVQAGALLSDLAAEIELLGERVQRLVSYGYFDTAVREACLSIESTMRKSIQSAAWGDALVTEFIQVVRAKQSVIESQLRTFRGQLRMLLKFIRNDYMHNFMDIDEQQCRALLHRIVRVKVPLDAICNSLNRPTENASGKI